MSRDNAEPGLNGCQIIQVPSAMQQIYHHKSLTWRTKSIISRFDQLWKSLLWISTAPPKFNIAPEKCWLEDYFPILRR